MSWLPVDFSTVRYSSIEGTHYFFDPEYPYTIQFIVNSKWESFDVGFVRQRALDAEIRNLAEEAEKRLVQDPGSGYPRQPSSSVSPISQQTHADSHIHTESVPSLSHSPRSLASTSTNSRFPDQQPQPVATVVNPQSPLIDPELRAPGTVAAALPPIRPTSYDSPYAPRAQYSQPSASASGATAVAPSKAVQQHTRPSFEAGHGSSFTSEERLPYIQQLTTSLIPQQASVSHHAIQPEPANRVILSRSRETKILLSIDGDGVRGLSSLLIVESLVNAICAKVDQRLDAHQIFDLTGGSSLGGVLAILLCRLQMQPRRAREAYKRISKQVFANKRNYYTSFDPPTAHPETNSKALEDEIKSVVAEELGNPNELLPDSRPDAGDVFVVSTHIDFNSNKAALIRSYETRRITGPELDANMPIWKAMTATTVAPCYSKSDATERLQHARSVMEPGLVDHGTAKNNPTRDILYECRKLFRYTNDMMIIISIGTGIGIDRSNEIPEMVSGVETRQMQARNSAEKFEEDFAPLMERTWLKYFRFNVPGLEDVPLEEWAHEDVVMQRTSAYLAQPDVGKRFYACVHAIVALLVGGQKSGG